MFSDLLWIVLSLIAAMCMGAFFLICQYYKTPGHYLVIWPRLLVLTSLMPILFLMDWPQDPRFYIAVALTGIIAGLSDLRVLNISSEYGGGIVSRLQPLGIGIAFFLWLIVKPEQLFTYLEHPFHALGIMIALTGCVYFSSILRKCTITGPALQKLLLPIFGYACNIVIAKYAFDHSPFHSGVFFYLFVQSLFAAPLIFAYAMLSKKPEMKFDRQAFFSKSIFVPAFFMFLIWSLHMVTKNYANTLTPNPSYVAALVLTCPVWVMLFYKIVGHKEDANISAGIGIMISAIMLALLNLRG